MARTLETYQKIQRSIIKKYRQELWKPFTYAIKKYELIQGGGIKSPYASPAARTLC